MRIAILATASKSKAVISIREAGISRGHEIVVLDPTYLALMVSGSASGYDRTYDTFDAASLTRINIKDIDAIIPRLGRNTTFATSVLHQMNRNLGIWSAQSTFGIRNSRNKLQSLQLCSAAGIKTPRTVYTNSTLHLDSLIDKLGGLPIVLKTLMGSGGSGVSIVESLVSATSVAETFFKSGEKILLQEYIRCGGEDYRAIVMGGKVIAAMRRTAERKEFRANIAKGGKGETITLTDDEESLCAKSAEAVGLGIAGVDFIRNQKGEFVLIEVNSNPGWKICDVTGVDLGPEYINYVEEYRAIGGTYDSMSREELIEVMMSVQAAGKHAHAQLLELRKSFEPFTDDPYLERLIDTVRGKRLRYRGRDGKVSEIEVGGLSDLYKVIAKCITLR